MALFGKGEDKAAEKAAAAAEADRLCALATDELAITLMGAFAPVGGSTPDGRNVGEVILWPMTGYKGATRYVTQLRRPTEEALQRLEKAGLIVRTLPGPNGWLKLTRVGEAALAEDTVQQYLAGPTAP